MTRSSYVGGLTRFDKGDLSGAVADFNQAIQTQSDYAEAYFYRGLAYSDLRQMPKSIADYSKNLALNAGYVEAYYNRGLVLSVMGDKPGDRRLYSSHPLGEKLCSSLQQPRISTLGLGRSKRGDRRF